MKIGELARISRCPAETIRYYERIGLFPNDKRTSSNYRMYDRRDIERLRFIRHCRNHDMSLADIRKLLSIKDGTTVVADEEIVQIFREHMKNVQQQMDALGALVHSLEDLLVDPHNVQQKGTRIIDMLSAPCPDCSDYETFRS